ncbi:transglutaminase-like domain-containing protein [Marispirochaeta sp.]|uniref:transglutaminase-like domain-containing protein n=1 Tax=Marispirochaeta sp. TaxID=2038653 RepID=UPI0029C65BD8|nr:transglutaminase-like domain-containing protein [Marispirochaeta sp.]
MTVLFILRTLLYLGAMAIPFAHRGVVIDYDLYGLGLYFLLIPGQAVLAFFFTPPQRKLQHTLTAAGLFQLVITLLFAGSGSGMLHYLLLGMWSFLSTCLLFRFRWRCAAIPELIFLAAVYLRLVNFTRGLSSHAGETGGLPQLLLFIGIAALLGQLLVIMLILRRKQEEPRGFWEYLVILAAMVPVLLAASLLVPPDFVQHSVVFNQLFAPPEPEYRPLEEEAEGLPGGNLRDRSPLEGLRRQNGQPGLYGLPADRWGEGDSQGDREGEGTGTGGRQYAIMVVSSPQDPTYLADGYFDSFDPVRGFGKARDMPLNEIVERRLLETWINPAVPGDRSRLDTEIFTLSTIAERALAYLPLQAEPTIYDRSVYPFSYSYPHVAAISITDPYDWVSARDYRENELRGFEKELDIDMDPATEEQFRTFLESAIQEAQGPGQKILAILKSFEGHQYEIGFDEDVSVNAMELFLFTSKSGDCTEFSNTAAILGRLAGIPSRVVTGYLASEGLQTMSHLQGLMLLQVNIPSLKKHPLEELYLVTSAHRHSWAQFYLPDYGWIDFETTRYAIPPPPGGDPNSRDVVIPLIENRTVKGTEFQIPWKLIGQSLASFLVLLVVTLYGYRYGREFLLRCLAAKPGRRGLLAAEKLLLVLLANEGVRLKKRAETPREYAEELPELGRFAHVYEELRFKVRIDPVTEKQLKAELLGEIHRAAAARRRRGLKGAFLRLVSLKGVAYR